MLELTDVRIGYGESTVVWDLSLEVGTDDIVAVLGRNGAGKTTTLRGILGLTPPTSGRVEFRGEDITGLEPYEIAARGIGYVPQSRDIFGSLSVENNIRLGSASLDGPLLKDDVDESILEYFPALEEKFDQKGGVLSGGQQQQLAIARALNSDPDLLLLDEPSEGIQPSIVADITERLQDINRDRDVAILIVEQNLDLALEVADHCYVLESGRLVESGPTDELTAEDRIAKHISV
jgi:urea ABC transporter ATP-binding protein UrtE